MRRKTVILFYFLFFQFFSVLSQVKDTFNGSNFKTFSENWGIDYRLKIGYLIGKRGEVANLPRSHTFATELSFVKYTDGKKLWHSTYNYPTIGFTLFAASVGNKEILGNFYGSYGFIEFPFIKNNSFELCSKLGSGLAYTSKLYDPIYNPKNSVISSHVNTLICFGIKNKFKFGKNQIVLGIDLTHCSNGAYKVPNIGINMPFVSIGYSYRINDLKNFDEKKTSIPYKKILYGLNGVYSIKEIFPTGQGNMPVYGFSFFTRYFSKPKVGYEFSFDVVSKQIISKYKPEIIKTQSDLIQIGMYSGYLLPLDKFHLVLGMGINLRDKYQPESLFYHRVGMRYYFASGINLNVVLRSNWSKADFAEWGIGYTFNYK